MVSRISLVSSRIHFASMKTPVSSILHSKFTLSSTTNVTLSVAMLTCGLSLPGSRCKPNKHQTPFHYKDTSVLLENAPLVKFIQNYIRDSTHVFSLSPLKRIWFHCYKVCLLNCSLCFLLVTLNSKGRITKAKLCLLGPSNETGIKSSAIYWPQRWPFIF